jgi:hypothetical protein
MKPIRQQTKLTMLHRGTCVTLDSGAAAVAVAGRTANGPTMRLWERFTDAAAPEAG